MKRLKTFLPLQTPANRLNNNDTNGPIEPQVGFKLCLHAGASGSAADNANGNDPELHVQLIGARHLPSSFGLKSVEGYMVKVKLFPGAMKFDSSIQTTSWPTFDETFRFPLVDSHKSSFRAKKNEKQKDSTTQSLPEKFFNGKFVVFTVFALLELPPGYTSTLKSKTMTFIRQGSQRLKDKPVIGKLVKDIEPATDRHANFDQKQNLKLLTTSESQRNLGSVTYFLDSRSFASVQRVAGSRNGAAGAYATEELWLPVKDITVTQPSAESRIAAANRGEVEVTLQLCDYTEVHIDTKHSSREDRSFNIEGPYSSPPTSPLSLSSVSSDGPKVAPFESQRAYCNGSPVPTTTSHKNRFSFDVRKIVRSVKNKDKNQRGLCLKISTAKVRCSIRVKEGFEEIAEKVYVKTTVLEHQILTASWKSEPFRPALSSRWNAEDCTLLVPLSGEATLDNLSIKIGLAAKNKVGKKIRLGTVFLGPMARQSNPAMEDQWRKMIDYKGSPISVWHRFEEDS
uniref:C2 domain-containing protein n=1 Tax=Anopheles atroparvus TaxID=41427 RepID=A0A182JAZ4_ANOAO